MKTDHAVPGEWLQLAASPYFIVEKGIVNGSWNLTTTEDSFTILVICEGSGHLTWDGDSQPYAAGECYLIPSSLGLYTIEGHSTVLRSYLP